MNAAEVVTVRVDKPWNLSYRALAAQIQSWLKIHSIEALDIKPVADAFGSGFEVTFSDQQQADRFKEEFT